ncbi:MAG: hypothetical protein ACOCTI_02780 [Phycisphaeraceae bacterium]
MRSSVRHAGGRPTLEIGLEPYTGGIASLDYPGDLSCEKLLQYEGCGVRLFVVANSCKPYMLGWDGTDRHDYRDYEGELRKFLRRQPDARFIVQVGARPGAPCNWCRANPGELVESGDGLRLHSPSLASDIWRRDSLDAIRRFVEHFESSDLAEHIAGYLPILSSSEWHGFGECLRDIPSQEIPQAFGDYSEPMQAGFCAFLKEHYAGDVDKLRRAWGDPDVTFDSAELPGQDLRRELAEQGAYPADPARLAPLRDYFLYYNQLNADLAVACCDAVKEAAGGEKVVGLMHGYLWGWPADAPCPQGSGHAMAERILAAASVDFLYSPSHPEGQALGEPRLSQHAPASAELAGKVLLHGIHSATHASPRKTDGQVAQAGSAGPGQAEAADVWDFQQLMLADAGFAFAAGAAPLWMDYQQPIWGHWFTYDHWGPMAYDTPAAQALIGELTAAETGSAELPRQIAVISSAKACCYRNPDPEFTREYVEHLRRQVLPYVGASFDEYLLEDVAEVPDHYRLYVFLDAEFVPAGDRQRICERLERQGAWALWLHAPGFADEQGWDLAHTAELTGIAVERVDEPGRALVEQAHLLAAGLNAAGPQPACPFAPAEEQAGVEVLARFESGRPAVVLRRLGEGGAIYSATPRLPRSWLAGVAEQAGVHLYSWAGDIVCAGRGCLAITSPAGGEREIRLPGPLEIHEMLGPEVVSVGTQRFRLRFKPGETRLLKAMRLE